MHSDLVRSPLEGPRRSATPNTSGVFNAASELGPQPLGETTDAYFLAYWRHGQADESVVHRWHCLYVGREDLCVLPQIEGESVTGPTTFHLHHVERHTPQQILESRPDSDTMALQRL